MTAAEIIDESRRKIDEWVQTRPPALHLRCRYELPDDRDRVPARLAQLLDKVFPISKTARFSSFGVAAQKDAESLDSILFYARRAALLDKSDESLQTVLDSGLSPDLERLARITQAYGRIQFLLWHLDVGNRPELPISAWQGAGEIASGARRLLSAEAISESEWIDAVIRIEFVLGWASLASGDLQEAIQDFLFVIGWYASAEQLGYPDLLNRRYNDWLRALYAILDYGFGQSNQVWRATASVLLKDLRIGQYRVKPPFVAMRSPEGARKLNVQLNPSLAGEEWFRAFSALGEAGAFVDLILTDRFIHTRLCRLRTTRDIRNELPMVTRPVPEGEESRGEFQITPLGAIVMPSVDLKERQRAALVEQWHPSLRGRRDRPIDGTETAGIREARIEHGDRVDHSAVDQGVAHCELGETYGNAIGIDHCLSSGVSISSCILTRCLRSKLPEGRAQIQCRDFLQIPSLPTTAWVCCI